MTLHFAVKIPTTAINFKVDKGLGSLGQGQIMNDITSGMDQFV